MAGIFYFFLLSVWFALSVWVVLVVVKLLITLTDYISTLTEESRLRMARSTLEIARKE